MSSLKGKEILGEDEVLDLFLVPFKNAPDEIWTYIAKEVKHIWQCLEQKKDLSCAANNNVRCLIALGRNADAKKFVNSGAFQISKTIRDRVKKLDHYNARLKKQDIAEEPGQEISCSRFIIWWILIP